MSKATTPQEKKRLSLERDRRNVFRENSKASRKGIALSKARSHRGERRAAEQALADVTSHDRSEVADDVEASVHSVALLKRKTGFRKVPDQPLAVVIPRQIKRREKRADRCR